MAKSILRVYSGRRLQTEFVYLFDKPNKDQQFFFKSSHFGLKCAETWKSTEEKVSQLMEFISRVKRGKGTASSSELQGEICSWSSALQKSLSAFMHF